MSSWQRDAVLAHLGKDAGGASAAAIRRAKKEIRDEAHATLSKGGKTQRIGKKKRAARILAIPAPPETLMASTTAEPPPPKVTSTPEPPPVQADRRSAPKTSAAPPQPAEHEDLDALAAQFNMRARHRR